MSEVKKLAVNPLEDLRVILEQEIHDTRVIIEELVYQNENVALIPDLAKHIFKSGGKFLRPILTLASYRLCNLQYNKDNRVVYLATSVEFMHTATLLHDDVVDDSKKRRGQDTANNKWGNKESILVGDFLLGKAFELMVQSGSLEALQVLSSAASVISEGEVMQLDNERKIETSFDKYLKIVKAKTAELFASACQVGAIIADVSDEKKLALRNYGMNLGIAFQIIDDVIDYSPGLVKSGKKAGDDFREGKVTLPVILAIENASGKEELDFWKRVIESDNASEDDFKVALKYINNSKSLESSVEFAEKFITQAIEDLAVFPDSEIKEALINIAEFSLKRDH